MREILYKVFLFWLSIARKYEEIKMFPEKREKDVSLGVTSLVMSIIGTAATLVAAYYAYKCFTWTGSAVGSVAGNLIAVIFCWIGGAICALISVGCFIYMVLASIVYAHYQRKLNNNPVGLAALIISIILIIGIIVAIIVFVCLFAPTIQ